jgi:solute carrier family 13 (sodium-dependent dicarboxylate transporter), member 2/3/5
MAADQHCDRSDQGMGDSPDPTASVWQRIGVVLGPALAAVAFALIPESGPHGLDTAGRTTAAVGVLMAVWWISEALPLPVTALLPLALFPVFDVAPIGQAARPYATDVIFLFMCGFMLGLAMERWGLHKRLALRIILLVGTGAQRLVAGFMIATALLSMWISNTATTIILLPVAATVVAQVLQGDGDRDPLLARRFATCLMLAIAYSASIGGASTLIGSPPNLVVASYAQQELGCEIGMLDWMRFGLPALLLMLPLAGLYLTRIAFPFSGLELRGGRAQIRAALRELGPMSRGEILVGVVFVLTALAWMLRPQIAVWLGVPGLSDTGIAVLAALLLFTLRADGRPVIDWPTAARLPWGVLLLFGGGLSLAAAISAHGVDRFIASGLSGMGGLPPLLLLAVVAMLVIFATELTSNTAIATAFTPVLAAIAVGLGAPPVLMLVAIGLGANYAFMMPVATPPNAIVFGSGHVSIAQMARAGFALNWLAIAVTTAVAWWAAPRLCG